MKPLGLLSVVVTALLATSGGNAYAQSSITVGGTLYTFCGSENNNCTFSGTGSVIFGAVPPTAPSSMLTSPRTFKNGVGCYVGAVSQTDPAFGYGKSCWVSLATKPVTPPVTTPPVTTPPVTTPPVTTPPTTPPAGSSTISCATPTTAAGGTARGVISADTPTTDGLRIFQNNTPFKLAVTTNASSAEIGRASC